MSIELNKLKKKFNKIAKKHAKYLNLVKRENNYKTKELLINYLYSLVNKMENIKRKKIKMIAENAKKEKAEFKRKANNAFNTPKKGPAPKKNKPIISPIKFEKNMQNLQRGLFLTPNRSKSSNKK